MLSCAYLNCNTALKFVRWNIVKMAKINEIFITSKSIKTAGHITLDRITVLEQGTVNHLNLGHLLLS